MEFKEMKLVELVEFWNKDAERESPELDDKNRERLWIQAFTIAAHQCSGLEILQALYEFKVDDWLDQIDLLKERFLDIFAGDLLEDVKQLKTTVALLLKQHEGEPANITVGQLNHLKHGLKQ